MKVAICRPIYQHAEPENEACVASLCARNRDWRSFRSKAPNIDIARALLAEEALRYEAVAMLWIDSDIALAPEDAERLVAEAVDRDAVVGALYLEKGESRKLQGDPLVDTVTCFANGSVIPARRVAFGIVALPCSLYRETAVRLGIERVRVESGDLVLPMFLPEAVDGEYRNDDYAFCARVERAGLPMFVDTRPRVHHFGRCSVTLDDVARVRECYESITINIERTRRA